MSQAHLRSTCAYCGVGCGVQVPHPNDRSVQVSGDPEHPANSGRLCVKGSHLGDVLPLKSRLLHPMVGSERVSWDQATEQIAAKLVDVLEKHGPEAIAFYLSGQLLTEDYYAANKLAKGFLGTANVDTNSRLCMSSAVAAHIRAFGEDAPPLCYDDLEDADLVVLVGSNLAWTHPILFQRLQKARERDPNKKLVVVDPRRTVTAKAADLHLPISPGCDGQLFNALLLSLDAQSAIDSDYLNQHVNGYDAAVESARADVSDDPTQQALKTGLNTADLATFKRWFATHERTTTVWSMGINQSESGVDKSNAIINVHLATGRIGKPGANAFSVTGQPNAMGGREVGGLANQLAAHRMFDEASLEAVGAFWDAKNLARKPGLKAIDLFDACRNGHIKFLWVMGTNPVASLPDADHVRDALRQVDTVVVSDVVLENDTLPFADIRLPALAWGEKDGTVTNSERTISRQRAFLFPPGQALADWQAIARVGKALGHDSAFDWHHAHDVFREHAQLSEINKDTPLQFCLSEVSHLSFRDYQDWQPKQWPLDGRKSSRHLFTDGCFATEDGRANMIAVRASTPMNRQDGTFVLNTGRLRDQWHTMSRTAYATELNRHSPVFEVHIHPDDAACLGIANGDLTRLHSDQGECFAYARHELAQSRGQLFASMHWNRTFASHGGVARVISSVTDPISGQPASKHSRVAINSMHPTLSGYLFVRTGHALPEWVSDSIHFTQLTRQGRLLRVNILDQTLSQLQGALTPMQTLTHDSNAWVGAQLSQEGLTHWCSLSANRPVAPDPDFLDYAAVTPENQLNSEELIGAHSEHSERLGKPVCTCFSVTDRQILKYLADHPDHELPQVQSALKCGTNCGSCLSEVVELVEAVHLEPN